MSCEISNYVLAIYGESPQRPFPVLVEKSWKNKTSASPRQVGTASSKEV